MVLVELCSCFGQPRSCTCWETCAVVCSNLGDSWPCLCVRRSIVLIGLWRAHHSSESVLDGRCTHCTT